MRSENSTIFGGISATLLWENPNPNVAFPRTTLDIDVSSYKFLIIKTIPITINPEKATLVMVELSTIVNNYFVGKYINNDSEWSGNIAQRAVRNVDGKLFISNAQANSLDYPTHNVPIEIYGVNGSIQGIK